MEIASVSFISGPTGTAEGTGSITEGAIVGVVTVDGNEKSL